MNPDEMLKWFLVIVGADLVAAIVYATAHHFTKSWWKKRTEAVMCEVCQKPRKIRLTQDNKVRACRTCRKLYNESVKAEVKAAAEG